MEDGFDFEAYLEAGAGKLTGYCAAVVGPADAGDAAQEAYLRLWRNLDRLPNTAAANAFLYKTAFRICVDLLRALFQIYSRGGRTPEPEEIMTTAVPKRILYSVRDKSRHILSRLCGGSTDLNELYRECTSRSEVVATFLSILELCSLGSIQIRRHETGYRVDFVGGDVDEILEQIEE